MCLYGVVGVKEGCNPTPFPPLTLPLSLFLSYTHTHTYTHMHAHTHWDSCHTQGLSQCTRGKRLRLKGPFFPSFFIMSPPFLHPSLFFSSSGGHTFKSCKAPRGQQAPPLPPPPPSFTASSTSQQTGDFNPASVGSRVTEGPCAECVGTWTSAGPCFF